ncbi:YlaH-like family protein [Psychrobacillus sp. NEAU-3TGS]|uniref:YlaH-like family protein n=1 Tax=Psychrobacillus sp. NEAU-3TGS TaxID=2995412 RepID=UPI002497ADDC|nr:YlaH-like family protein [Psychrobacillus sp. NEAU-3TGS]MDI2589515.1 YlaH-like family protein [Psychrobacillus sp. NEAU-3TGS]
MEEQQFVFGRMSSISKLIYEIMPNFDIAGYVLFLIIFLLSVLVYKLGFAKKLRVGQNIVIYVFLFLGCLMLTFLAFFLPVVEGLIVAALILIIYKIRLRLEKKQSSTT